MTKQRGHEDAIRAESCIRHVQSTNMIVIYSRVTKGGFRVLNANVTATVTLPGKDETVFLPLRDDGKGADVKADDGEYASYFTRYQKKGRYSVRTDVTVDPSARLGPARPGTNAPPPPGILRAARLRRGPGKMCAASNSSPECKKKSLGKLAEQRLPFRPFLKGSMRRGHRYDKAPLVDSVTRLIAYAGAFQLKKAAKASDLAPDRVRDLAVKNVTRSSGNLTVTLSWTSTGANLDTGRAKSLDLRSSLKSRDLVYKFKGATKITNDDVLEGDLTPKDPFSLHTVKVRLPEVLVSASQDKPGSIFLGLRTKNKRGKQSQVSNIAPVVWLAAVKTTTVKTTRPPTAPHRTSTPMTYKPDPYTPTTYTPAPYAQPDKGWSLATIMAVLLGLLFLVTVVIIGYYTLKRSSDDKRGNEERLAGYGDTTMGDTSSYDTTSGS
ncbi:calcium-activated chloride channel regulator 1-like [Ixodes scapularis]|uniref:calcium-activated chloride channel regulator 1-like n=1 Tax=Ixodes scapularis TaxID=6945 RepID=UPI001AD66837|nr:calcium-activated chloride channel regulator 1-like [Ixodes scapularis]